VGISVENQATADERIPLLLRTPAAVRWLSMEPLLGPVDLTGFEAGLDWVVVGGESGSHCRPMDPSWARSLRDQCDVANIPFFFKQWGSLVPAQVHGGPEGTYKRVSRKRIGMAGKMLDGRTHEAYPHQGPEAPAPEADHEM
jgi:protein gp37